MNATTVRARLSYDQTVNRELVHRRSLSEVFLTGYNWLDERNFACAAQLPLSHAYFRDYLTLSAEHDPLQALEAARQAVTCAAHRHQELPRETTFMVTAWCLALDEPGALVCGELPGRLRIDGAVTDRKERGGHVRRLAFDLGLVLDDRPLGRVTMDVNCTPTEQYHALRRMQRGGAVPTAFTLPAEPAGPPVEPSDVDRINPANTVLDDVRRADGVLEAVLSPRTFRNRSMYDHPYDHVPAMVLSEAARQCGTLLAGRGARPVLLDGQFDRFAELDHPVDLVAQWAAEPETYQLTAMQDESMVARISSIFR